MFKKVSKCIFVSIFFLMIAVPAFATNFKKDKISVTEKRKLAPMAELIDDDGTLNGSFPDDFEAWINDNIGFREQMVEANAQIQYRLFDVLENNGNMKLGPNGELNYITKPIVKDYQHIYLKAPGVLKDITDSFQTVNDYLSDRGIQFYYFQCWDKQSVYPEQFPNTLNQYGDKSVTEQIVEALENDTTVDVISPKEKLIDAKSEYDTYGTWYDPTHWTQRGAFIGYSMLMSEINDNNDGKYKVLDETDYNITVKDQGSTIFGGIHEKDMLEDFEIKNPESYETDEEPLYLSPSADKTRKIRQNDSVDNDDTLLILGDSYFDGFLYDDLSESFHRVVQIWGDYTANIEEIVDYYKHAIVVCENAERCDRTQQMILAAKAVKGKE